MSRSSRARCRPASVTTLWRPRSRPAFPSRRATTSTTRSSSCARSIRTRASSGVTVAIGCGLAPGLSDVLAAHAASLFESVDEIRVARTGWAGPASVDTVRHERRMPVRAWRDGGWREETLTRRRARVLSRADRRPRLPGRDRRDRACSSMRFPNVARLSVQLGEPPRRTRFRRRFGDEGEWGAARIEVWGQRDGSHGCVAYGVVDRTAVAAGAALAVVTARLAGTLGPVVKQPGVQGLGVLARAGAVPRRARATGRARRSVRRRAGRVGSCGAFERRPVRHARE